MEFPVPGGGGGGFSSFSIQDACCDYAAVRALHVQISTPQIVKYPEQLWAVQVKGIPGAQCFPRISGTVPAELSLLEEQLKEKAPLVPLTPRELNWMTLSQTLPVLKRHFSCLGTDR
ncbi:uncharacterized [Tachysurus ichikawai]